MKTEAFNNMLNRYSRHCNWTGFHFLYSDSNCCVFSSWQVARQFKCMHMVLHWQFVVKFHY